MSAAATRDRASAMQDAVVSEFDRAISDARTTSDHCARVLADIVISHAVSPAELEAAKVEYAISAARVELAESLKSRVRNALVEAYRNGGAF